MLRRSFRWLMLLLIAAGLIIPATIVVTPKAGYTQEEKKETGKKKKGKKGKKGETKDDLKYRYQVIE
jgi:hypothetical protein